MANFLDYIIGMSGRAQRPHAGLSVSTPPDAGAGFRAIGQMRQATADREQRQGIADAQNQVAQQRLGLDLKKFGLDADKADQAKREFFAGKVKEALALINSGDEAKIAAGEAMLRSAGGDITTGQPQPLDSIGRPPADTPEEQMLEAPPTKEEAEIEAAKGRLDTVGQAAMLPGLLQGAGLPPGIPGAMDALGFTGETGGDLPLDVPAEEPSAPPAGVEPGVGTSDTSGDEGLGVTSGIPYAKNAMDGTASPRPFVVEPGKYTLPGGGDDDITGMAMAAAEDPVGPPPVRLKDEVSPQMEREVVDPFGNTIGTVRVGESDAVFNKAMEPVASLIHSWAASTPDAPVEEMLAMGESIVRGVLSDFDGSITDAIDTAYDAVEKQFETIHQDMRASTMAPDVLGFDAANKPSDLSAGGRAVKDMSKQDGYEGLKGQLRNTNESVRMLMKMKSSLDEGLPVDTIAFYSVVYQVAKGRDPGGRVTDKDFDYSKGQESLGEKADGFVARTLGISASQFLEDFSLARAQEGAVLSPITVDRFTHHMQDESVRLGERRVAAQVEVQKMHQQALQMGSYGYANGIAQSGNYLFDAGLEVVSPLEAAQKQADTLRAYRASGLAEQGVQQGAAMTPEQRESELDALISGAP